MLGILVHGDNHFIARGPQPDRATARALNQALVPHSGGSNHSAALQPWSIGTCELRENLQWAVVAPGHARYREPSHSQRRTLMQYRLYSAPKTS